MQVTHSTVRVIRGSSFCLQDVPLAELLAEANHPAVTDDTDMKLCIKYAQIRDPYVVLLLSDHHGTVLLLQGDVQQQRLVLVKAALRDLAQAGWEDPTAAVTAVCLYTDTSGWLAAAAGLNTADGHQLQQSLANGVNSAGEPGGPGDDQQQQEGRATASQQEVADDEDALMAAAAAEAPAAGESPATAPSAAANKSQQKQREQQQQEQKRLKAEQTTAAEGHAQDTEAVVHDGKRVFIVPESDAVAAAAGESDAAAGALEGMEGVDAAMAEAAADQDPQEAVAAATDPAADETAAETAAAIDAATFRPQQLDQQEQQQQQAQEPATAAAEPAASLPGGHDATADTQPKQQPFAQKQPSRKQRKPPAMSFCCIVRAGGSLELYALPDMTCVFQEGEASLGHQVRPSPKCVFQHPGAIDKSYVFALKGLGRLRHLTAALCSFRDKQRFPTHQPLVWDGRGAASACLTSLNNMHMFQLLVCNGWGGKHCCCR